MSAIGDLFKVYYQRRDSSLYESTQTPPPSPISISSNDDNKDSDEKKI